VLDIDNDGIVRIARVDLIGERPGDDLVSSNGPETCGAKSGLGAVDGQCRHLRARARYNGARSYYAQRDPAKGRVDELSEIPRPIAFPP